jgi:hypothetical protein
MKQKSLLAPKTFFPADGVSELNPSLNLSVALARAPGKIAFWSGGRVEDFACVDVGRCNDGRVGVSLSEEAQMTNNGASNAKAALAVE